MLWMVDSFKRVRCGGCFYIGSIRVRLNFLMSGIFPIFWCRNCCFLPAIKALQQLIKWQQPTRQKKQDDNPGNHHRITKMLPTGDKLTVFCSNADLFCRDFVEVCRISSKHGLVCQYVNTAQQSPGVSGDHTNRGITEYLATPVSAGTQAGIQVVLNLIVV